MLYKAIFIDKDGTLIPDIPYNVDPKLILLNEDAVDGLRMLKEKGHKLIVISNQSGVGRGYFEEEALQGVKAKIESLLKEEGIDLDGFYYCPHYVGSTNEKYNLACDCRKPKSGMLLQAAQEHSVDLTKSWMIGDILNDVEAGKRAGCRAVLIDNGGETEWIMGDYRTPDLKVRTIDEAAIAILKLETEQTKHG